MYNNDNLHASPNIIRQIKSRRIRWVEHDTNGRGENVCMGLVGKPEGKSPRIRWENGS
jgi:hypothetical protein